MRRLTSSPKPSARVFFEVGAHQAHGFLLVTQEERHLAALYDRDLELADLVALGQVGVKVVLAGKNAHWRNVGAEGQSQFDSASNSLSVHHGQRAGQRQVYGAGLRVGFGAEGRGGAAEDLALRGKLGVGFEADDNFVAVDQFAGHVTVPRVGGGGNRWPVAGGGLRSAGGLRQSSCR